MVRRKPDPDILIIKLNGMNFEVVTSFKYPGHLVTTDLRDDDDIK